MGTLFGRPDDIIFIHFNLSIRGTLLMGTKSSSPGGVPISEVPLYTLYIVYSISYPMLLRGTQEKSPEGVWISSEQSEGDIQSPEGDFSCIPRKEHRITFLSHYGKFFPKFLDAFSLKYSCNLQ